MIKANSEKELLSILKIFAQESVKKAKNNLSESVDPAQESYLGSLENAKDKFEVDLSERDDQENVDEEEEAENSEVFTDEDALDKEEVNSKSFETSFDSVVKSINMLRAGRSTKDKEIKGELLGYYDRLSESERKILHIFLKQLANILQGAIDGDEAIDPSDPPLNAKVEFEAETDGEKTSRKSPNSKSASQSIKTKNRIPKKSGEDTSAPLPISVGGEQDLNEIRKRVQRLMKRF